MQKSEWSLFAQNTCINNIKTIQQNVIMTFVNNSTCASYKLVTIRPIPHFPYYEYKKKERFSMHKQDESSQTLYTPKLYSYTCNG